MNELFGIVHEDDDLLVINKPAGLVCHPTKGDVYSSLISRVRLYLGETGAPQLINRLDRETSGVVLVAKGSTAAREVRQIWESRSVQKDYLAIVHGWIEPQQGLIDAPLGKDEQSTIAIKDTVRPDGAASSTEYRTQRQFSHNSEPFTLLDVRPRTGRKHQIRIHLAWRGHPIVGDKIYGRNELLYLAFVHGRLTQLERDELILECQALHARQVQFTWRGQERTFAADPESWFTDFLAGAEASGKEA